MTDYALPATATGIDLNEINGALLLITVHKQEFGVQTSFGAQDPIRADVVVLDGANKGTKHDDTLLFPKVLQGQLKSSAGGKRVLGRLGKGEAKPGQSAPWKLTAPTEDDIATARKYDAYILTQQAPAAATDEPF
jgi:hypothetical protein